MVFSVSTLFLAALVFNAASTIGAPLRFPDTSSTVVARSEDVASISGRFVSERGTPLVARFAPIAQPEAREEAHPIIRRFPRRALQNLYEKREPVPEPGTTVKETTVSITKVTTHDTPEDAAAYIKASPPGADKASSTVISFAQTVTIPSVPTPTPAVASASASATSSVDPSAAASASSSAVTSTATATATGSGSAGAPTAAASSLASSSAAVSTATGAAATGTSTGEPANATPTSAPSGTVVPLVIGEGDKAVLPAVPSSTSDAAAVPSISAPADPSAVAGGAPSPAPEGEKAAARRANVSISGRHASSGATLATAMRRALEETFKL